MLGDGESSPRCAPNHWPPRCASHQTPRRHPSLVGKSSLERSSERPQPITSIRSGVILQNTTPPVSQVANIKSAKGPRPGSKHIDGFARSATETRSRRSTWVFPVSCALSAIMAVSACCVCVVACPLQGTASRTCTPSFAEPEFGIPSLPTVVPWFSGRHGGQTPRAAFPTRARLSLSPCQTGKAHVGSFISTWRVGKRLSKSTKRRLRSITAERRLEGDKVKRYALGSVRGEADVTPSWQTPQAIGDSANRRGMFRRWQWGRLNHLWRLFRRLIAPQDADARRPDLLCPGTRARGNRAPRARARQSDIFGSMQQTLSPTRPNGGRPVIFSFQAPPVPSLDGWRQWPQEPLAWESPPPSSHQKDQGAPNPRLARAKGGDEPPPPCPTVPTEQALACCSPNWSRDG